PGNRRVTGADLSIEMLRSARCRVGGKCRLLCADVSRLPFKPESFDFIFASHVLQFVADVDLDGVVAEFARCLPPGGLLVATGQRDEERAAPFTIEWADIEELINVRWMPLIPEGEREQAAAMLAEVAQAAKADSSRSLTLREPLILGRRDS